MKTFKTEVTAISPITGQLVKYEAAPIWAESAEEAQQTMNEILPYVKVLDEVQEDCEI